MKNVFAFVPEPKPLESLTESGIYKIMEKLNNGGELTTGTDDGFDGWKHKDEKGHYITKPGYDRSENDYIYFNEIYHPETYKNGIYRLMGWIFDFRPFFKKYLVKWEHLSWQEHYAPDEDFIKINASEPNEILKIIEVDTFD